MKNHNKLLAVLFSSFAALLSALLFIYIADRYPAGASTFILAAECALVFAAAVFLAFGALGAVRNAVIASEAFLTAGAAMLFTGGFSMRSWGYYKGVSVIYIVFTAVLLSAAILTLLYTLGKIKCKYAPAALLTASFLLCVLNSAFSVTFGMLYISAAFLISAFLLIVLYPDIFNEKKKVSTAEIIVLTAATFGIYFIFWAFSVVKKTNALTDRKCTAKYAAPLVLFPPYRPYWYYTIYEELSEKSEFKNRGTVCAALSVGGMFLTALCLANGLGMLQIALSALGIGIELCALAVLQKDLNDLCPDESGAPCNKEASAENPENSAAPDEGESAVEDEETQADTGDVKTAKDWEETELDKEEKEE